MLFNNKKIKEEKDSFKKISSYKPIGNLIYNKKMLTGIKNSLLKDDKQ